MSFDVNILVNGSRCKQYHHQGKTYIQANPGSEYTIELKNNHWKRILAVGSVDGLNVLSGQTAKEEDTGYIVDSYSTEKIKGFRVSDSEWALFKFGYKFNGNTYAQTKNDGSEKNCGVIGLRFFYEQEPTVVYTTTPPWPNWNQPCTPVVPDFYNTGGIYPHYLSNVNYTSNTLGQNITFGNCMGDSQLESLNGGNITSDWSGEKSSLEGMNRLSGETKNRSANTSVNYCSTLGNSIVGAIAAAQSQTQPFDMGTEFGRKEQSRIKNVQFERGCLAQSFDIYYASRESLIAMGVPIHNTLSTNLPQSFPNQYCQPPKNWVG